MTASQSQTFRRILSLLLWLFCIWMLFSVYHLTARAARSTGTVKNQVLNVRSQASTGSSIVCKLSKGAKVTILSDTTGADGMKWYNVYFAYSGDTREGFVRADLINVAGQASSTAAPAAINSSLRSIRPNAAIVRSYPSTGAEIVTRLYKGTIITINSEKTADDGRKWAKVTYNENGSSKNGYIRSDLLAAAPAGASMTAATTPAGTTEANTAKYINTNVALVRTYASTNGDIRTRLVRGTNVTVIKTVTGQDDNRTWYKVSYNSNGVSGEGYIRGDLLANGTSNTAASNTTSSSGSSATVIPAIANIRTYASTNGDIRSKLPKGTAATIITEKTGDDGRKWYKISYTFNGVAMEGYIRGDLLTIGGSTNTSTGSSNTGNSGTSSSGTSSSGSAQVLSYASPYADVRTTLPNGAKVTVIKEVVGEDGEKWTKISFTQDGKTVSGYVRSSILK